MIPNTDSSAAPSARGRRLAAIATFLLLSTPLVFARVTLATCGHSPKGPAARVAGEEIGYAEVEELVASQLRQLEQQRHELMSNALDRLVENRLLELEAGRQETTVEVLLAAERGDTAVTDAEVDAWYEANQARIRQPKEQVADQVRGFLEQQQIEQARQRLLQDLDSRYAVEKLISPYRLAADVGPAPVRGHGDAPVKVVLYSDFECPYCQRLVPAMEAVEKRFGADVAVAFRHFHLNAIHPKAQKAAEAAACADRQGKFWPMHDSLFGPDRDLSIDGLKQHARRVGLDGDAFDACLDTGKTAEVVAADLEAGQALGVASTPSIFVNGRPVALLRGRSSADQIGDVVKAELERATAGKASAR